MKLLKRSLLALNLRSTHARQGIYQILGECDISSRGLDQFLDAWASQDPRVTETWLKQLTKRGDRNLKEGETSTAKCWYCGKVSVNESCEQCKLENKCWTCDRQSVTPEGYCSECDLHHLEGEYTTGTAGISQTDNHNRARTGPSAVGETSKTMSYCAPCKYSTNKPVNLKRHVSSVHGPFEERIECLYCIGGFRKEHYDRHIKQIHPEEYEKASAEAKITRPWKCSVCGAGFPRRNTRDRHEREIHPFRN